MKNNNKNMHLFAIAALAATLMVGQVSISSVYAGSTSVQLSSLIPDNVTVEQPVPLSDISLPDSEYGTLSWVCRLRGYSHMMSYLSHTILLYCPRFLDGMENLMRFMAA